MSSRVVRSLASLLFGSKAVDRLERAERIEDAWYLMAHWGHQKWQADPAHLWTLDFAEESHRRAHLAARIPAHERAWFAAQHAALAYSWKGVPEDAPEFDELRQIVAAAEAEIPDMRLKDLAAELEDHARFFDPARRYDLRAKSEIPPRMTAPNLVDRYP